MAVQGEKGYTTGADASEDVRRRNVQSTHQNGSAMPVELDDKKKQQQV